MRTTLRLARRHYVLGTIVVLVTILAGQSLIARVGSSIASMHLARRQQTATMLASGSVLLAGGENGGAAIADVELFDPSTGRITRLPRAIAARASHTATLIAGGRVLLAGGRDGIVALDSTELFDPASGTFSVGPRLQRPRAGHAATVMADGRVLITGGDGERTAEIYDGAFHLLGREMDGDRRDHSALLLRDGTVLVTGGRDAGGTALATAEVFDPQSESFTRIGSMSSARVHPVMHPLPDGKVQIVGGDADATMEIYDPSTRSFTARAYLNVLQPHAIANSVATFAFVGRHLNTDARRSAIAAGVIREDQDVAELTPVEGRGEWLVSSGDSSSGRTLSPITVLADSAAWVTTDKADYAPGEVVTVTGGGFAPNETVTLLFERNPETSPATTITTVADADGNITNFDYTCLATDANVTFTLTATGTSGAVAITSFTDAPKVTAVSVSAQGGSLTSGTAGSATYTVSVTRGSSGNFSASLTVTTALPLGVTFSFSPATLTFANTDPAGTVKTSTLTLTTTAATPSGATGFTVRAANSGGDFATGNGTLTIASGNTAPTASAQSITTNEDTAATITLSATDADGDALTFALGSTLPTNGTLGSIGTPSCSGTPSTCTATVTYTPNANYNGSDSFTFTASDASTTSAAATVSITVTSVNDAPVATAQSVTTAEDTAIAITLAGTDVESDPLTYIVVSGPSHGTYATGIYTPAADYNGSDSFTFKANDGTTDSTSNATVSITINAVNDAPVATAQSVTTDEDTAIAITLAGTDVESDPLTYTVVSGPSHGTFTAGTYTPAADYNGTDSFTFKANDGTTDSASNATVSITINSVNDAPVATPQSVTTDEDTPVGITLAGTDVDVADSLTYTVVSGPSHGTFTAGTYTPAADYNGSDSFTFKANDGTTDSASDATVSITINPVNDAPVATPQSVTTDEDTPLAITLAGTDVDGDGLTYSVVDGPDHGDFTAGVYTPDADYNGSDSFTFKANDGSVDSEEATVSITINAVNDAPVLAAIGNKSASEGTLLTFTASATDVDIPPNTLTYSLDGGAPSGASINSSTGVFTWTPGETDGGSAPNVTIRVTDNGSPAKDDFETIVITVAETNEAPVLASIGNKSTPWGTALTFSASATDADLPANTLTYSLDATSMAAGMSFTSLGAFSWTPTSADIGAHTVTITVTDNGSPNLSDSETFTITVGRRATTVTYGGDTTEQYSDQANVSATLVDATSLSAISGATITFTLVTDTASATTNGSGVAATTLIVTQAPGTPNMVTSFAGDTQYLPSSDSDVFTVTQEDARVYNTTPSAVSTGCGTCTTTKVTFSATITDITAETTDSAYDAFAGDISNAIVDFVNRDASNALLCTANVGLVSLGDTKVGTAACESAGPLGEGTLHVGIVVRGYYTRNDTAADDFTVNVAIPQLNSISGGGYLVLSAASGQANATQGTKNNFGFNVKYNKSGKNLQGNINTIIRSGSSVLQIKGNALTSLTVNTNSTGGTATFVGKANLQDVTDPLNPVPVSGNFTLQVQMTDAGEPGNLDTIAITVFNKDGGIWYTSNWDGRKTIQQKIAGGNLSVH